MKRVKKFQWHEFDLSKYLSKKVCNEIIEYSINNAIHKILSPCSVTSREDKDIREISTYTVDGESIRRDIPYLFELYNGIIYEHAKTLVVEQVLLAKKDVYAINLNVQNGKNMRYECHVDSNPLQGVLNITSHNKGSGGELVVSHNPDAIGVNEIDKNCEIIYPKAGKLLLFDATENPHYVRHLKNNNDVRVSMTMNFYTPNSPESARPIDLNNHLF